jgi:hypothetical protein
MCVMSVQWTNRMVGDGSSRVVRLVVGQPSWAVRAVLILAVLALFALVAVIVIPLVLIGGALLVTAALVARVRNGIRGLRAPNGVLDERKNVRVIVRE